MTQHANQHFLEPNLLLEMVRVTETAALNASSFVGHGNKAAVDAAGADAMRSILNSLPILEGEV